MHAKSRPITSTEVRDQIKVLVRAFRKGDTSWDTPWAANQLFTRNAISLVMKFRQDIAQQDDRMGNNSWSEENGKQIR
jgi:hypothetical protein